MTITAHHREFLTIRQAAERLRVSEKTIRRKIAEGQLRAVQLGRPGSAVRINESELEAWLYGPRDAA